MPVVKATHSVPLMKQATVLDLGDIEAQAARLISRARGEAERIMADARAEAQRLVDGADERGHAEGFARGEAEGRTEGAEAGRTAAIDAFQPELCTLREGWMRALAQWEAQRAELLRDAREDALRFAVTLAERIVRQAVAERPELVCEQVRGAFELISEASRLTLVVHPDDVAIVRETLPALARALDDAVEVELAEDPAMERGGCIVRTARGAVDARISTQLTRIAQALVGKQSEHPIDQVESDVDAKPHAADVDAHAHDPRGNEDAP